MTIDFYTNFYKKDNSTKRPTTGGAGNLTAKYTVTGILKEPCSILEPVISLQNTPVQSMIPAVCTYAYIPKFFRYYWVTDWMWNDGLWTVKLKVDVLASWKTHIGEQTEYILRTDSTTDFNGEITDTTYPATTDFDTREQLISSVFASDIEYGIFVVGIIAGDQQSLLPLTPDSVGAITYYAMDFLEFNAFKEMLFSNTSLNIMGITDPQGNTQITDMSKEVLKTLYNPYQYIASCIYFPFDVTLIPNATAVTGIDIGWWHYPTLSATKILAQTASVSETCTITDHPQIARGSYLNYSPYSRRTCIGRFGTIAIDNSYFKSGNSVGLHYVIDMITGQCRLEIQSLEPYQGGYYEHTIGERQFLLGVPIQIAQIGLDYITAGAHAVSSAAHTVSRFMTGDVAGGISTAANGIANAIAESMPQLETSGTNGSFISPITQTHFVEQFYQIVDEDISHRGRPLCELKRIDTLSGFILCAEGELDLDVYEDERRQITRYLTSGFFWE